MTGLETAAVAWSDVRARVEEELALRKPTIDAFHKLWYDNRHTWAMTYYRGVPVLKNPLDLWVLQDVIHDLKPALIVETGTAYGGSALFMADALERNGGAGAVISIDITPNPADVVASHPKIWIVQGSSVDHQVVAFIEQRARRAGGNILVVLDSDHHQPHVAKELAYYARLVPVGGMLIVEDTNLNGRPVLPEWGPGPAEAVDAFLALNPNFVREPLCERYLLTMHPGGWLRRVA